MSVYDIKTLRQELVDEDMRKHPNMAASFPRSYFYQWPNLTDKTANGLTDCIIHFIKLHGGQAERIAVMGKPLAQKDDRGRVVGYRLVKSQMTKGTADISATIDGRSVKIEVKIGGDRQSDTQRRYQQDVVSAGGYYFVAKDFVSFTNWYFGIWSR